MYFHSNNAMNLLAKNINHWFAQRNLVRELLCTGFSYHRVLPIFALIVLDSLQQQVPTATSKQISLMMPPLSDKWVHSHLSEIATIVVRHEIAEYTQVNGVHPAAKHSTRRDVARAGISPELDDSTDDEGQLVRTCRRDRNQNRREGRCRRGSSDTYESSDQAVTTPPPRSDGRQSLSRRRDCSPNALQKDQATTPIAHLQQVKEIPLHEDASLLEANLSPHHPVNPCSFASPSTIACSACKIC